MSVYLQHCDCEPYSGCKNLEKSQSCVIVLSRQNTILEREHGARGELK